MPLSRRFEADQQCSLFSGSAVDVTRYGKSQKDVNNLSVKFYITIGILFIIVLGMPFHVVIYHLIRGTYRSTVWFLPYKTLYVRKERKFSKHFYLICNFLHFHASGCRLIRTMVSDMLFHWPHKLLVCFEL